MHFNKILLLIIFRRKKKEKKKLRKYLSGRVGPAELKKYLCSIIPQEVTWHVSFFKSLWAPPGFSSRARGLSRASPSFSLQMFGIYF